MTQQNIEIFYCKTGVFLPHQGEITIRTANSNPLHGSLPTQILENLRNNLWDFGLPDRPLIKGEDIIEITLWDRACTKKFSDQFPDGVPSGKGGTARTARPSIY